MAGFLSGVMSKSVALAAQHGSDEYWMRVAGEIPSDDIRQRLARGEGFELKQTRALQLQTLLAPIDEVARVLFLRSWWLVTFAEPLLFTSQDPVILAGPRGVPLGVGTADEIHLPVSPHAALVMQHPQPEWEDKLLAGSEVVASRLNTWHLARSTSDSLLLDPRISVHPLDPDADGAPAAVISALRGPTTPQT